MQSRLAKRQLRVVVRHAGLWSLVFAMFAVALPSRAQTAALTFAWPPGLFSRVSFENVRTTTVDEREKIRALRGSYTMSTEAAGANLLVRISDMKVTTDGLDALPQTQRSVQQLVVQALTAFPDYLVDGSGSLLEARDLKATVGKVHQAFSTFSAKLAPTARERVNMTLSQVLTEDTLRQRLTESWNRDVGSWAGANLELGQLYAVDTQAPAPLLGDQLVPIQVTFEYVGDAPCSEGAAASSCVKLRMRSTAKIDQVGPALQAFVSKLADATKTRVELSDFSIETTVRLLSEPNTLLPHHVIVQKHTTLTVTQGTEVKRTRREDVQQFRYLYRQ
ncbi:MAG: hypothetical protein ACI9W2_004176 [Gammaproteobacteria bacterium]|jgi:hypothetical protein